MEEIVVRSPRRSAQAVAVQVQAIADPVMTSSPGIETNRFDEDRPPIGISKRMEPDICQVHVPVVQHRKSELFGTFVQLVEDFRSGE